jgi:hypothetical protein
VRTSDVDDADMRSRAMDVGSVSFPSLASRQLWFKINHSWYGSNFDELRVTGKICAFERSVPIEGNVLLLPIVLLEVQ